MKTSFIWPWPSLSSDLSSGRCLFTQPSIYWCLTNAGSANCVLHWEHEVVFKFIERFLRFPPRGICACGPVLTPGATCCDKINETVGVFSMPWQCLIPATISRCFTFQLLLLWKPSLFQDVTLHQHNIVSKKKWQEALLLFCFVLGFKAAYWMDSVSRIWVLTAVKGSTWGNSSR